MTYLAVVSEALGWALVHFAWQGGAVAGLLALLNFLLRHNRPQLRYLAACGAMLLMLVLPIATLSLYGTSAPALPIQEAALPIPHDFENPRTLSLVQEEGNGSWSLAWSLAWLRTWLPWSAHLFFSTQQLLPWLAAAWLAGVLALSLRLIGECIYVQRFRQRHKQPAPKLWQERLEALSRQLRLRHPVTLFTSSLVDSPTVIGVLRPVILLPASVLTGLTPQHLEAVLAHELAHVRRHDYLINLLQSVIEVLLFYHPAVWWVSQRVREERELCCDDIAAMHCGDALSYARALTHLEILRSRPELALAATGGSLMKRIARLSGLPTSAFGEPGGPKALPHRLGGVLAVIALSLAGLVLAACAQDTRPAAGTDKVPLAAYAPICFKADVMTGTYTIAAFESASLRALKVRAASHGLPLGNTAACAQEDALTLAYTMRFSARTLLWQADLRAVTQSGVTVWSVSDKAAIPSEGAFQFLTESNAEQMLERFAQARSEGETQEHQN